MTEAVNLDEVQPRQPRRAVDGALATIESAVSDLAKINTKGLDRPPHAPHGSAESVERHINAQVARSTQAVIEHVHSLRDKLDRMEALLIQDSARVQAELQAHIRKGATMAAAANIIEKHITELEAEHADLAAAQTRYQ